MVYIGNIDRNQPPKVYTPEEQAQRDEAFLEELRLRAHSDRVARSKSRR